eukprot:7050369-Alexandrium_andersonii.AAC.1
MHDARLPRMRQMHGSGRRAARLGGMPAHLLGQHRHTQNETTDTGTVQTCKPSNSSARRAEDRRKKQ